MSGYADARKQMPPQPPPFGPGLSGIGTGNILTSGIGSGSPQQHRSGPQLAQGSASSQPVQSHSASGGSAGSVSADQLFQQYLPKLYVREGGTANRPKSHDRGGLTHKGVSTRFLGPFRAQNPHLKLPPDPRQLTQTERDNILRAEFFDRAQVAAVAAIPGVANAVPQLPEQLFDAAVLHGPGNAGKFLQRALDRILGTDLRAIVKGQKDHDGIVGSKTRAAIAEAVRQNKLREVNNAMAAERKLHMRADSTFSNNRGWIPRAKSFEIP